MDQKKKSPEICYPSENYSSLKDTQGQTVMEWEKRL